MEDEFHLGSSKQWRPLAPHEPSGVWCDHTEEMASLSKLTFSGKVLTEPQNGGNMAFLDMSLGM